MRMRKQIKQGIWGAYEWRSLKQDRLSYATEEDNGRDFEEGDWVNRIVESCCDFGEIGAPFPLKEYLAD